MEKFVIAGVGSRPVIWVAHSAGGVIVKKLLEFSKSYTPQTIIG
jgi:alpha-beta hydrolase superfamily lysophospholipase